MVGSSAHLLSSSPCSSPAFHLGSGAGQMCDYSACSRAGHTLHRYAPPLTADSYSRLAAGGPATDTFSAARAPAYVGAATDADGFPCGQIQIPGMPGPTPSQLQYLMPGAAHNAFATNQGTQSSYGGFRLHSPYGLYGYNFSTSPRLAASPEKMAATQGAFLGSSPSGTLTDRQVLSPVDGLQVLGGGPSGQQSLFDSRTLGSLGAGLTSSGSQVTAHMA